MPVHDKNYRENFARSLFLTGKITQETAYALSPRIKELIRIYPDTAQTNCFMIKAVYEVRARKDKRGVDLISDALPFGRLWYDEPDAIINAIGYASSTAAHMMR